MDQGAAMQPEGVALTCSETDKIAGSRPLAVWFQPLPMDPQANRYTNPAARLSF